MFRLLLATLIATAVFTAGAKPCLAGQVITATYDEGETVEVKLPAWGGQVTVYTTHPNGAYAAPTIAHVELSLRTGYYKGDHRGTMFAMPSIGAGLRISEDWFLRGSASAGIASDGSMSDFSLGLGVWATDFVRLTFAAGQIVRRSNTWTWVNGGPVGKVTLDVFLGRNGYLAAEGFGGPSWNHIDQLSPAYGGGLNLGWRF